jgi:hypothetical protein
MVNLNMRQPMFSLQHVDGSRLSTWAVIRWHAAAQSHVLLQSTPVFCNAIAPAVVFVYRPQPTRLPHMPAQS